MAGPLVAGVHVVELDAPDTLVGLDDVKGDHDARLAGVAPQRVPLVGDELAFASPWQGPAIVFAWPSPSARVTSEGTLAERERSRGVSVVEDGQIEFAQALRVCEHVDGDDLPVRDCEAHDGDGSSTDGYDDSRGTVHEHRP